MIDRAWSLRCLRNHFSHPSGPGVGLELPRERSARRSVIDSGTGHWKGSEEVLAHMPETDGEVSQGFCWGSLLVR